MEYNKLAGSNEMYKYFRKDFTKCKDKFFELNDKRKKIYRKLTTGFFRKLATQSLCCDYKAYLNLLNKKKFDIDLIRFKEVNVYHIQKFPEFLQLVKQLNEINYEIALLNAQLTSLENRNLKLNEFSFILSEFNSLLSEQIVKGNKVNLGYGLGFFEVLNIEKSGYKENEKMYIDKKLTNRYRRHIIDNGGIPKSKMFPDGEEWVIMKPASLQYNWLKWNKGQIKGVRFFKFIATEHLREPIDELIETYKTLKEICLDKIGLVYKIFISNKLYPELKYNYRKIQK
jgi:hypothetical protein